MSQRVAAAVVMRLMVFAVAVEISVTLSILTREEAQNAPFLNDTFPAGFLWGAGTSSYQIEGSWNVDGKGPHIWDTFCHKGGFVYNNQTGDVACDSYRKYELDVANLKNLGVNFYRFSISWPRIIPTGKLSDGINEMGVAYYNKLINALLAVGIAPLVTLYHWEMPQPLYNNGGGWLNPDIIQRFNDFANVCFQRYGDRVKHWLTINQPSTEAAYGYGQGFSAPGMRSATNDYIASHNMIKAHATVWHTYDNVYRSSQAGRISIVLASIWPEPRDVNNSSDVSAAERNLQFNLGWHANPIFVNGDYPDVLKAKVAVKSYAQGFNKSRLPQFTEEEKLFIKGTCDFFALNHYSTNYVSYSDNGIAQPGWVNDRDVRGFADPSWPRSGAFGSNEVPWGMRKLLCWIRDAYGNPPVIITENGVSDDREHFGRLADQQRIRYHTGYINNVLKAKLYERAPVSDKCDTAIKLDGCNVIGYTAWSLMDNFDPIKLDGCNVIGYTAWSLMDNFEWNQGYSQTFGLYRVNFSDPARPRTPKDSVSFFKKLIADNGWPQTNMTSSNSSSRLNYTSPAVSIQFHQLGLLWMLSRSCLWPTILIVTHCISVGL